MNYPWRDYYRDDYRDEMVLHSSTAEKMRRPVRCYTKNCLAASTGALQLVIGIVSIVFGIVVVLEEYGTDKTPVGIPIWAGAVVRWMRRRQGLSKDFEVARHIWKSALQKWSQMVQTELKLYKMIKDCHILPVNNERYPSKWRAWRIPAKALVVELS